MNEKIHAKGWRVDDRGYCIAITGYGRASIHGAGSDDAMIATLNNFLYGAKKNAALIAAAPEMYNLLLKISGIIRHLGMYDTENDQPLNRTIDDVMKKARGEG